MASRTLPLNVALLVGAFTMAAIGLSDKQARADGPAPSRRTSHFEIRFMTGLIDHHNMAVEMAELCADRAVHEELKDLCHEMIAAQTVEIEDLQSWLHDWYGISYDPHMTRADRKQLHELARLHGRRFEIAFLRMMVEHHTVAIEEAEECVDRAFHEDLIELCHNVIESQSDEIEVMESWLCQWYHICDDHGRH